MSAQAATKPNASATTKPSLTLKRRLKASPERVFAAWTEPEKVKAWFGPRQTSCTHVEFDLRVGGRYRMTAVTPDGEKHEVGGVLREVVPNERLVYTWAWHTMPERESLVTVEFKPDGDGTLLTLTHAQFVDEDARDRHQFGWNGALDKLEQMFT